MSRRLHGGWFKRSFDVVVATLLLILLSPVLVLCALAVLLGDGRPILYRQERVGRYGQGFQILKFRTMRPEPGVEVTVRGDHRITAVGRALRRFKLDELPQLWNVLVGEMSLVGARPEVRRYVSGELRAYGAILVLRPGITDFASLIFRDEEELLRRHAPEPGFYERTLLPRKVALARLYKRHRSFCLDLRLLLATAHAVLFGGRWTQRLIGDRLWAKARGGLDGGVVTRRGRAG